MTLPADPPPITIPPPRSVAAAGVLVLVLAAGLVGLAGVTVVSGLTEGSPVGQTLAQGAYYLALALLLAVCATAVLRGRRWGRTPCLVVGVVTAGIGVYLALPSGQPLPGAGLVLMGLAIVYLLVNRRANAWIERFPLPFAEDDRPG